MAGPEFDNERPRPRVDDENVYDRVFDAIIYFGVGQLLLLGAPMLWMVYLTPIDRIAVTAATASAMVVIPLTIAALRLGVVDAGRPWQKLDEAGLGTNEGYATFLLRTTHLNSSLALVAFGVAGLARLVPGVPIWPVGALVAAGSVLVHPWLARPTTRARAARFGYHAVALTLVVLTAPPTVFTDVGFYSFPFVYGLCWLLVLVESRPLFRDLVRSA